MRAVRWSHLARRGPFLQVPTMQRNQRISSRSAIPTQERLASREPECTWQTSGDEERLATTAIILRKLRRAFSSLSFLFLFLFASSGVCESTFQVSRQIHIFCRNVNRYVQTSFAAEVSAQFLPSGIHEPAFSGHRHA